MTDDGTARDVTKRAEAQTGGDEGASPAERALAEAAARRAANATEARPPTERGGRGGPDPVRFGDWEIKGRAVDF